MHLWLDPRPLAGCRKVAGEKSNRQISRRWELCCPSLRSQASTMWRNARRARTRPNAKADAGQAAPTAGARIHRTETFDGMPT